MSAWFWWVTGCSFRPQQTQPHEIQLAVSIFHSLKNIKTMKELNRMCELLVLRSNEVCGLKRQFTPFKGPVIIYRRILG